MILFNLIFKYFYESIYFMDNIIGIIGDVHGCFYTLKKLFDMVIKECQDVYSVGDIIDRGNYSKEVVEFFIENKIKTVRGNHEDMLINAVELDDKEIYKGGVTYTNMYFDNGARATERSYINSTLKKDFGKFVQMFKELKHYDFIKSFPFTYEFEKIIIAHAGIVKGGSQMSLLWNREVPSNLNKLQVHGHSPQSKINFRKNHFVNIDTGCVYGNMLSAIVVDTKSGELLKTYSIDTDNRDI